jgi:glycosyltransferase involved in cell wall biosynthesis
MIWLASFPRSGNTFLRNILYEVYGLNSSTFHRESDYPLDENYDSYPFVKTHELPEHLTPGDPSIPAICLIRDGRDALCSMAHHRSDIVAPGSDYLENLRAAIIAQRGSHFGGWSMNVEAWCQRAQLLIRYEDLIADPLGTVERLRLVCDLPEPQEDRLPAFEALKFGIPKYGAARDLDVSEEEKHQLAHKFFRRGEAGAWREEMPEDLQALFWSYHGDTMQQMGYRSDGSLAEPDRDIDWEVRTKLGFKNTPCARPYRVLIEADKLASADEDGVKRYQLELMRGMFPITQDPDRRWEIDLFIHGKAVPLADCAQLLEQAFTLRRKLSLSGYAAVALSPESSELVASANLPKGKADGAPIPLRIERLVMAAVPRRLVAYLSRNDITLLHDAYESVRLVIVTVADFVSDVTYGLVSRFSDAFLTARRGSYRARAVAGLSQLWADMAGTDRFFGYDLLHLPLQQHYRPFRRVTLPRLVTIHDLTHIHFPESHTRVNVRNAERGLRDAEARRAHLLCVSKATADEVVDLRGVSLSRKHICHLGADPRRFSPRFNDEDRRLVRDRYGIEPDRPYLLCLSTLEPRKNLINTIEAFKLLLNESSDLDLSLVIAGKRGWGTGGIDQAVQGIRSHIQFTGFVDDNDVAYLYSDALALSYVSYYEGFGLPPLEAMRCGTPVIFGNNSSMIEVVGDGGLPADPSDVQDIARQFRRIVQYPQLRAQKSAAALRQANKFSWRQTALGTLSLYETLIDETRSGAGV